MSNGFEDPQGGFRAPRIPFDLRCVLLGGAGYLVLLAADWLLGLAFGMDAPIGATAATLLGPLGRGFASRADAAPAWWQMLLATLVFLAIWSLFGGAIMRAAALRLTRDDPLSLRDALGFGGRNWISFLAAPALVALFAVFFLVCNMAAGLVLSLWGVGSTLLNFLLFPLVLLSSLLITLSVVVGVVSVPLMWAGIAVEQNGALASVSAVFSYVFARPFRFLFGYALIFLLIVVVLFLAGQFETVVKGSLQAGIVRGELDELVSREPGQVGRLAVAYENAEVVLREKAGITDLHNIGRAAWYDTVGFFWMWLLLGIALLCFKGYAVYVLLGGTASLYLQLRREVDGTDEQEIHPPLEEEGAAGADAEPRWVGEPPPPAAAPDEPGPEHAPEGDDSGSS